MHSEKKKPHTYIPSPGRPRDVLAMLLELAGKFLAAIDLNRPVQNEDLFFLSKIEKHIV